MLRHAGPIAALLAIGLLAYSNAFGAAFTLDDQTQILRNPLIRDLGNYLLRTTGYAAMPGRYVAYLTFALDYRLGRVDPFGWHASNVCVHLANALLVYAMVVLTFRTPALRRSVLASSSRAVAFVAAALFVAHPIQTQAVIYVVQRETSLATTFYLLATVLYADWRLRDEAGPRTPVARVGEYVVVLVAAVLAMRTKEIAFTWPVSVCLWEIAFFGRPGARRAAWLVPVVATALVIPLTLVRLGASPAGALAAAGEATRVQTAVSRWDYLVTQFRVIARYLRLLVLPVGQNLDYEFGLRRSLLDPGVLASLALLLGIAAGAFALFRARALDPVARLAAFGIAWFFIAISVESSIIPIADVIMEHRVYLPSAGLFASVAAGAAMLAERRWPRRGAALALRGGLVAVALLAAATFARNRVWRDEVALWSDVVAKSPGKGRPRCNLGVALAEAGRAGEAIPQFREAIRLAPGYPDSYDNLGLALADAGRREEAAAVLLAGLRVDPDHAEGYYDLGRLRATEGRYDEAADLFATAVRLRADHREAYANLGAMLNRLGRPQEAARTLEGAGAVIADSAEAQFNLGVAYVMLRDRAAAERQVRALEALSSPLAVQLSAYLSSAR